MAVQQKRPGRAEAAVGVGGEPEALAREDAEAVERRHVAAVVGVDRAGPRVAPPDVLHRHVGAVGDGDGREPVAAVRYGEEAARDDPFEVVVEISLVEIAAKPEPPHPAAQFLAAVVRAAIPVQETRGRHQLAVLGVFEAEGLPRLRGRRFPARVVRAQRSRRKAHIDELLVLPAVNRQNLALQERLLVEGDLDIAERAVAAVGERKPFGLVDAEPDLRRFGAVTLDGAVLKAPHGKVRAEGGAVLDLPELAGVGRRRAGRAEEETSPAELEDARLAIERAHGLQRLAEGLRVVGAPVAFCAEVGEAEDGRVVFRTRRDRQVRGLLAEDLVEQLKVGRRLFREAEACRVAAFEVAPREGFGSGTGFTPFRKSDARQIGRWDGCEGGINDGVRFLCAPDNGVEFIGNAMRFLRARLDWECGIVVCGRHAGRQNRRRRQ